MLERSARRASLVILSLASTLALLACGGGEVKPKATGASKPSEIKAPQDEAKEPTKLDNKAEPKLDVPGREPVPAQDTLEDATALGGDPTAAGGDEAEGGDGDEGDENGEAEGGGTPDDDGKETAAEGGDEPAVKGGGGAGGKDSATLIKEARTTKTTDDRALAALAEAETAGATIKELARAAKARGDYLYKAPDRAKVFYEWSAAKDETYADPVFALAKQKAVTGDVADVVKLLKQVSERKGGKKLLEQIDFDPTWDIVKDDSDVRALL